MPDAPVRVIPGRSNRTAPVRFCRELYGQRDRIERVIGHRKIARSFAARRDEPAERFLGMAQIAAIRLEYRRDA